MNYKNMRKEIYESIREALLRINAPYAIAYIDVWNQNTLFPEGEVPFPLPAGFVEFVPTDWTHLDMGCYKANQQIRLHIVTEWAGPDAYPQVFDLINEVAWALHNLCGKSFKALQRVASETTHQFDQLLDMIETYQCVGVDEFVKNRTKELGGRP